MKELKINGVTYAIKVHQNDPSLPCLLMLHGFMGDGRVFHHLIEDLAKSCNPVTVDLLGHGKSQKPLDPVRYEEKRQIADIIKLIKQIELSPIFLYGYSMGGRLALKTALDYPELFSGLILESANNGVNDSNARAKRRETDEKRAWEIENNYGHFLSEWEKLGLFKSPKKTKSVLINKYRSIQLDQNPQAIAASLRGFGTGMMEPVSEIAEKFHIPVLIIFGTADHKYVQISSTLASFLKDARLSPLRAGHRVHLDNPEKLTKEINSFIDQNSHI